MAQIFPGRYTVSVAGSFAVFLIGTDVNRAFAVRKWLPVAWAMPPMLAELSQHRELGFLGGETLLSWRGVTMIQYWKSFEHLTAYAQSRDAVICRPGAAFNRTIGNDGTVGIWHETYLIEPHRAETVYVNMPRRGLAHAADHLPITGLRERISVG